MLTLVQVDRREQLLDAAQSVFATQGYSSSKVSDVVARAGVAQGTFYLYFKSKQEIALALFDRFCAALVDARREDAHELGDTPAAWRAGLVVRSRRLIERVLEHRELASLFLREVAVGEPELDARIRAFHREMALLSERQLAEAVHRGFARPIDTRVAALAINGLWERVMVDLLLSAPELPDVDALVQQLVSLQLDGVRARPMPEEEPTP